MEVAHYRHFEGHLIAVKPSLYANSPQVSADQKGSLRWNDKKKEELPSSSRSVADRVAAPVPTDDSHAVCRCCAVEGEWHSVRERVLEQVPGDVPVHGRGLYGDGPAGAVHDHDRVVREHVPPGLRPFLRQPWNWT